MDLVVIIYVLATERIAGIWGLVGSETNARLISHMGQSGGRSLLRYGQNEYCLVREMLDGRSKWGVGTTGTMPPPKCRLKCFSHREFVLTIVAFTYSCTISSPPPLQKKGLGSTN